MEITVASQVPTEEQNADGRSTRAGTYPGKRLHWAEGADGLNFHFVRNEFVHSGDAAFHTPRHRHTFAQVKFLEKGQSNYEPGKYIGEGDIAYFPRMAYYGPQTKENCISIGTQFGFNGEHQKGPVWEGYRQEALRRLKAKGTVEAGGMYRVTDPTTGEVVELEPVEAVYAEQYRMHTGGKEIEFRDPGFDAVVLMHPANFTYYPIAPGVEFKRLGQFHDWPGPNGDVRISMVKLSDNGTYRLGVDRAQVAWVIEPGLQIDGQTYPDHTSVYCPREEECVLSAEGPVEVYILEYPRLD